MGKRTLALAVLAVAAAAPEAEASGLNDWNCQPSGSRPYPVVLVHGRGGDMHGFGVLVDALTAAGHCVFATNYGQTDGAGPYGMDHLWVSGEQIDDFIQQVLAETGADKVDVIGHSAGTGVLNNFVLARGGGPQVHRLVSFGGLHHPYAHAGAPGFLDNDLFLPNLIAAARLIDPDITAQEVITAAVSLYAGAGGNLAGIDVETATSNFASDLFDPTYWTDLHGGLSEPGTTYIRIASDGHTLPTRDAVANVCYTNVVGASDLITGPAAGFQDAADNVDNFLLETSADHVQILTDPMAITHVIAALSRPCPYADREDEPVDPVDDDEDVGGDAPPGDDDGGLHTGGCASSRGGTSLGLVLVALGLVVARRRLACGALVSTALAGCALAEPDPVADDGEDPTPDPDPEPAPFAANVLWTEHLGALVGTARTPYGATGIRGTDLGVSFPVGDQLVFLLGDTWTVDGEDWDVDSVALASAAYPGDGALPALTWQTGPTGRFLPLTVPGVDLGGMNVPVDGVAVGDTTYVFFTTGYDFQTGVHSHSVLAHTTGTDFANLVVDHIAPSTKFLNLSVVIDGDAAYLFGSGAYRESAVYLARAPLATLADRSSWTYFHDGAFVAGEAQATPIVDERSVGELSVRKHPRLGVWLMAYNGGPPRGIHLRTAASPAGPWSAPTLIYEPALGYGAFVHQSRQAIGYDDGLGEPDRENEWGGEYAPYLVPEWFDGADTPDGTTSIVYTLSSWNPYTVHLMRTVLGDPDSGVTPPVRGEGLPRATIANGDFATGTVAGWSGSGDTFSTFVAEDGTRRVTTFTEAEGDDAIGQLWQEFTVDAGTTELVFRVHGGHAAVELVHGDDVVRTTRGEDRNDPETLVRWNVAAYRGETLRVVIDDDQQGLWGFVGATGFELR